MFGQIGIYLVDTVFAFFVLLLLARFHFQWLRVPFRNPVGEFVLATTSWIVMPARRVIPGLAGLDLPTLLLAGVLQALGLWLQAAIAGAEPGVLALADGAGVRRDRRAVPAAAAPLRAADRQRRPDSAGAADSRAGAAHRDRQPAPG